MKLHGFPPEQQYGGMMPLGCQPAFSREDRSSANGSQQARSSQAIIDAKLSTIHAATGAGIHSTRSAFTETKVSIKQGKSMLTEFEREIFVYRKATIRPMRSSRVSLQDAPEQSSPGALLLIFNTGFSDPAVDQFRDRVSCGTYIAGRQDQMNFTYVLALRWYRKMSMFSRCVRWLYRKDRDRFHTHLINRTAMFFPANAMQISICSDAVEIKHPCTAVICYSAKFTCRAYSNDR